MPKIPMPARREAGPAQAPMTRMPGLPAVSEEEGIELQKLGATLRNIGGDLGEMYLCGLRSQIRNEITDATLKYDELQSPFLLDLEKDKDYRGWANKASEWHDTTTKQILSGMKIEGARKQVSKRFKNDKNNLLTKVGIKSLRFSGENERAGLDREIENAARTGKHNEVINHLEQMDKDGFLTEEEKKNKLQRLLERTIEVQVQNLIEAGLFDNARTILKNTSASDISPEKRDYLFRDIKYAEAVAQDAIKEKLEIDREKDRDLISKSIREHKPAGELIENSLLDEKEQWTWFERERIETERLAKGEDIVSDKQVEAGLESMAYDIWTGAIKKQEFDAALVNARYTDKKIDDAAYDELASLATREHRAYQANALKEAIDHAETQLVTIGSSALETLYSLIEDDADRTSYEEKANKRKLELDNHARYRKSLRDWFSANTKADADEIYIESRKLLNQFRRYTLKDIAKQQQAELPKEKFPLPPGTAALTPDGRQIGIYNPDGSITLNINGLKLLKERTGGDKELARKIVKEMGYVVPRE